MSVLRDNYITVKDYNKIKKFKDLETEIKNISRFKTTTMLVMVGTLVMIKMIW